MPVKFLYYASSIDEKINAVIAPPIKPKDKVKEKGLPVMKRNPFKL